MTKKYLTVPVNEMKTNFSRYLCMLESGEQDAIIVRRYRKRIAMLVAAAKPVEKT